MNFTASENDDSSLDKCFTEYVKGFHRMGYDVNNLNHNHLYHCCVGTYSHNCSIPDGKMWCSMLNLLACSWIKLFVDFCHTFTIRCYTVLFLLSWFLPHMQKINACYRYFWLIFRFFVCVQSLYSRNGYRCFVLYILILHFVFISLYLS